MPSTTLIVATFAAIFATRLYGPLKQKAMVLGMLPSDESNIHGEKTVQIPNTLHCEDIHHYLPSNMLYAACEEGKHPNDRRHWFPPLAHFDETHASGQGSIVVVDPKTFKSTRLTLEGFSGPLTTHGIDVITNPSNPREVLIYAINHLAHPEAASFTQAVKAASQVELFSHTIGKSSAKYIRSVAHPDIRTPNDIYATGRNSFYVTNDHHYRGGLKRFIEDLGWRGVAGWANTLHVTFDDTIGNATAGVAATEALAGLHNNNGLGHSEREDIILVGSAASGEITLVKRPMDPAKNSQLIVLEHFHLDTSVDNPSYYHDPWATSTNNASGYVIAGLTNAIRLGSDVADPNRVTPVAVWYVKRKGGSAGERIYSEYGGGSTAWLADSWPDAERWDRRVIFRDDGNVASAAATAVLVGVDPKEHGGKKKAWLFVTGFLSKSITATLVDL